MPKNLQVARHVATTLTQKQDVDHLTSLFTYIYDRDSGGTPRQDLH